MKMHDELFGDISQSITDQMRGKIWGFSDRWVEFGINSGFSFKTDVIPGIAVIIRNEFGDQTWKSAGLLATVWQLRNE